MLCLQKGLFTANILAGFAFSDTSDGPSDCLDTMEKADDDDKEHSSYSC